MSKERDLLSSMLRSWNNGDYLRDLMDEAKELLSEPEKPSAISTEYLAASLEYIESQKTTQAQEDARLRNWFAALAMQGMIKHGGSHTVDCENIAWCAYEQADAMLKERSKSNTCTGKTFGIQCYQGCCDDERAEQG